jgi:hypothetical protein
VIIFYHKTTRNQLLSFSCLQFLSQSK